MIGPSLNTSFSPQPQAAETAAKPSSWWRRGGFLTGKVPFCSQTTKQRPFACPHFGYETRAHAFRGRQNKRRRAPATEAGGGGRQSSTRKKETQQSTAVSRPAFNRSLNVTNFCCCSDNNNIDNSSLSLTLYIPFCGLNNLASSSRFNRFKD